MAVKCHTDRMRYFVNKLPDFTPGSRVNIDVAKWKGKVLDITDSIMKGMPPAPDNCVGGLYIGCAGVAYMFRYLASLENFSDEREALLSKARNYVEVSLSYALREHNRDPPASFLLGSAGTIPNVLGGDH